MDYRVLLFIVKINDRGILELRFNASSSRFGSDLKYEERFASQDADVRIQHPTWVIKLDQSVLLQRRQRHRSTMQTHVL